MLRETRRQDPFKRQNRRTGGAKQLQNDGPQPKDNGNESQTNHSTAPQMIHQYRQRIARTWRADTGRQPQVRVISYVMLNYKYPQLLPR